MSDEVPDRAARAFERHEAFERDDGAFAVTTTQFDSAVRVASSGEPPRYALTVRVPTLSAAVDGTVGDAVEEGWFETFERRLEDATMSTRADVDLAAYDVTARGHEAVVTFEFAYDDAGRVPAIAKAMAEFVEGTYVEGIVPGYDYRGPVADLLSRADRGEGSEGGNPTPL